jgi:cell division protein FtsW
MRKPAILNGVSSPPPVINPPQPKGILAKLQLDPILLIAVISLVVIGFLMVYSSSWYYSLIIEEPLNYTLVRQIRWALIGLAAALIISRFDYHLVKRFSIWMMVVTILLLVAVLIVGDNRFGSTRTLFNGSIQPSELTKLAIIIYLSVWLAAKSHYLKSLTLGIIPMMLIIGLVTALIFIQPDISQAVTIFLLGCILFFIGGGSWKHITLTILISLILGAFAVMVIGTGRDRIISYWEGIRDPAKIHYHLQHSFEAITRGGIFGVGIGKGQAKFTGLPVPWTDSIFAVIIEETGIVGAIVVAALYMTILWRGYKIAQQAPDFLGKLLAGGITTWIIVEALINMGVMIQLIPFAGNALPLISAGGSNMVTTLLGVGVILSVYHTTVKLENSPERSKFGAVVDLRWWNRGRSVPRPDGPESAAS